LEGLSGDFMAFGDVWERLSLPRRQAVIFAVLDRIRASGCAGATPLIRSG
jgi:hypothetical protein